MICGINSHEYDPVWWDVPLGLGVLMLLYFPLIFLKASGQIHKKIVESSFKYLEAEKTGGQIQIQSELSFTQDPAVLMTIGNRQLLQHRQYYQCFLF